MNKKTLRLLGSLMQLRESVFSELCNDAWKHKRVSPDLQARLKLVTTIKKQIEEQARGFVGKRLPYEAAGQALLDHWELPYKELHERVSRVLLG